jgi:hypothetical protein
MLLAVERDETPRSIGRYEIRVVHDVGRDAESGLLVMALDHLDGEALADHIASGRCFEWREALRIIGRVAEALHHAHAEGVVHRVSRRPTSWSSARATTTRPLARRGSSGPGPHGGSR